MVQEPLQFEDLISDLSAGLSNVPFTEGDQEIARALDSIRLAFEFDCCGLMEVCANRKQIEMVTVSCGEESERLARIMPTVNVFPWVFRRLVENGEPVGFSSLEKLPPEAKGEREFWEKSGSRPYS